jgi:p-aminobenzoyl-glutamate transporter AbgT
MCEENLPLYIPTDSLKIIMHTVLIMFWLPQLHILFERRRYIKALFLGTIITALLSYHNTPLIRTYILFNVYFGMGLRF